MDRVARREGFWGGDEGQEGVVVPRGGREEDRGWGGVPRGRGGKEVDRGLLPVGWRGGNEKGGGERREEGLKAFDERGGSGDVKVPPPKQGLGEGAKE